MTEPNPTTKRLRWVAERYPATTLAWTTIALAEALGEHEARQRLSEMAAVKRNAQEVLAYADERLGPHTRYDRHLPWLAREFDRIRRDAPAGERLELTNRFRSVVDWAEAERVDLGGYSSPEALAAAEAWADERRDVRDVPQGNVIYQWPDGWTVQQLTTQEQLDVEGDVMQHCVNEYRMDPDGEIFDPSGYKVWIFSLRDPKGRPHATMEFWVEDDANPHVSQLRGKQNAAPKDEYLKRMVEFRLVELADVDLEVKIAPTPLHADGLRTPLERAFVTPFGVTWLLYEDGTVLSPEELAHHVRYVEEDAENTFGADAPARRAYVVDAMDHVEPRTLSSTEDPGAWLGWAAWVATQGRVHLPATGDEMVEWLADTKVDPSICRPFARREPNVAELFGRLTR